MNSERFWVKLIRYLTVAWWSCVCIFANNWDDWEMYKLRYKKSYIDATEENVRQSNRVQNLVIIDSFNHNTSESDWKPTFFLRDNPLSDMTHDEYTRILGYKGHRKSDRSHSSTSLRSIRRRRDWQSPQWYHNTVDIGTLPSCVNWTENAGWVGPVLDQGRCGSCWAYSAVGSIQAQYYNVSGKFVQLSMQNLIDCSFPQGNNGCSGGIMKKAFEYVGANGVESLQDYPDTSKITGTNGTCRFNASLSVTSVDSYRMVNVADERALQQAVALVGPISVAVYASLYSFQMYGGGVYNDPNCKTKFSDLDHAMLLVGYGVYHGQPYWLVKNSWGTSWGVNGYMMMARNGKNTCGIVADATVPIIAWKQTPPDSPASGAVVCSETIVTSTPSLSHPTPTSSGLDTSRLKDVLLLMLVSILALIATIKLKITRLRRR